MSNLVTDPDEVEACWLRSNVTQLAEALDAGETAIDVADGSLFRATDVLLVGLEQMLVESVAGNTLTVEREYNGTTAAAYDSGAAVALFKRRRFRLTGPLNAIAIDHLAPKVVFGDYSKDSNEILSSWALGDLTEGHGIAEHDEGQTDKRYRFATLYTRYNNQLTKPFRTIQTVLGSGSVFPLGQMWDDSTTHRYMTSGLEFYQDEALRGTVTGVPADKGAGFAGTAAQALFYIPQGNNGYSTFNPATNILTNNNTGADPNVQSFLVWDNIKLIAIDNDGTISYATTAAATTSFTPYTRGANPMRLDSAFEPKKLHAFENAAGQSSVYVVTDQNVWVLDDAVPRLFQIPDLGSEHPYFGVASAVWRGELYVAAGMDILAYNGNIIRNMGLSRDDGLPWEYQGYIRDLIPGNNSLYAFVRGQPFGAGHYVSIHEWSGTAWHCIYAVPLSNSSPVRAIVTRADDEYRLVWGTSANGIYGYQDIPVSFTNPNEAIDVGAYEFGFSSAISPTIRTTYFLETGRFDAGGKGRHKIAHAVQVTIRTMPADNLVWVKYRINTETEWTTLGGPIATTGTHRLEFGAHDPNGHSIGIAFDVIELRAEVEETAANSATPAITGIVLSYLPRMAPSLAWPATLDCRTEYHDANPETMLAEVTELRTLSRFFSIKYRDRSYVARITRQNSREEGGHDTRAMVGVELMQIPDLSVAEAA